MSHWKNLTNHRYKRVRHVTVRLVSPVKMTFIPIESDAVFDADTPPMRTPAAVRKLTPACMNSLPLPECPTTVLRIVVKARDKKTHRQRIKAWEQDMTLELNLARQVLDRCGLRVYTHLNEAECDNDGNCAVSVCVYGPSDHEKLESAEAMIRKSLSSTPKPKVTFVTPTAHDTKHQQRSFPRKTWPDADEAWVGE